MSLVELWAVLGYLALVAALFIYVLPAIVARHRGKKNAGAICALNLLLDWTLVGWVIALVWALTVDERKE